MINKESIDSIVANIQPIANLEKQFQDFSRETTQRISTGFDAMDIALNGGFANELYILGAETSIGKSALMMDMALNVAKQGIDVLYFSLEMSVEEHIARGVSMLSFLEHSKDHQKNAYSASDILFWTYNPELGFTKLSYSAYENYANEYFKTYGQHLHIIEGGIDGFCAKDVANISARFKEHNSGRPIVVFIDYLQLLHPDRADSAQNDRKTKIDLAVVTLKSLASQVGMPVFVASSINRTGYNGQVSNQSFKESGDTEYTGGILIGWNWLGVTDTSDQEEKEKNIEESEKLGYRRMNFQILKARNSRRNHGIEIAYFPTYNHFVDEYGWWSDQWGQRPFSEQFTNKKQTIEKIYLDK